MPIRIKREKSGKLSSEDSENQRSSVMNFVEEIPLIIQQLVNKYATENKISHERSNSQYFYVITVLSSIMRPPCENDCVACYQKITNHLKKTNRSTDNKLFADLYETFMTKNNLKYPWASLYLMYALIRHSVKFPNELLFDKSLYEFQTFSGFKTKSTDLHINGVNHQYFQQNVKKFEPNDGINSSSVLTKSYDFTPISARCSASSMSEIPTNELDIVLDVIYALQGIQGKFITYDASSESYKMPASFQSSPCHDLTMKLCEIGWLYRKIQLFLKQHKIRINFGLIGHNFMSALENELSEYHRLLALLDTERLKGLNSNSQQSIGSQITLRKMFAYLLDSREKLIYLTNLTENCRNLIGGQLLSCIHSHTMTGNPVCSEMMSRILQKSSKPMNHILVRWIYEGKLDDPYGEFFVASNDDVGIERFWREKYTIRSSMMQGFITEDVAEMILQIGKSINFIRSSCRDQTSMKWCEDAKFSEQQKDIYKEIDLRTLPVLVKNVHANTCKYLLDVIMNNYQLKNHWMALRRYMLLGQGDLIRHLMDLLKDYLFQSASKITIYNMSNLLETAIRSTNAQFDKPEFLRRLDCRLLAANTGDNGWDLFSLHYKFDGPLLAVFTNENMMKYTKLFKFLWKFKRMEYILSEGWIEQLHLLRTCLQYLPDAQRLMKVCNAVHGEMAHFVGQMQYYFMFEVLECQYADLMKKVDAAKDFDTLLSAHDKYLDQLINMCFLHNQSNDLYSLILSIFDLIQEFDTLRRKMFCYFQDEAQKVEKTCKSAQEGTQSNKSCKFDEDRVQNFNKTIAENFTAPMNIHHRSFQSIITKFLCMILDQNNFSLKLLTIRLDFNGYYKSKSEDLKKMMRMTSFIRN